VKKRRGGASHMHHPTPGVSNTTYINLASVLQMRKYVKELEVDDADGLAPNKAIKCGSGNAPFMLTRSAILNQNAS
jgi:hypothetical protein